MAKFSLVMFRWRCGADADEVHPIVLGVVAVPQVIAALMAVAAVAMVWGGVAAVMTIAVVADVVPMEEDVFAVPAVHLAAVVVQAADVVVASKWDAALVSTTADEPVVVAATFRCWQMMNITATYNTSTAVDVSKQINSRIHLCPFLFDGIRRNPAKILS
ncbi:hypothetical protein ECG_06872 [Echinococcus granulosus]|nr:hypothetical protein ECG_06872 [Echinococcus granulosus]